MVFTGDTLFVRGTGRTDFQAGNPVDQYNSIVNKLLACLKKHLFTLGMIIMAIPVVVSGKKKTSIHVLLVKALPNSKKLWII